MVYLVFFLSGAAALVYEISWSRQIGLLFGNTVGAAAVVLAAYFSGMALGTWGAARIMPRVARPLFGYGLAELTVALWALATPSLLGLLRVPAVAALVNSDHAGVQTATRAIVAFATLLPATAALGATLPFISQVVSPREAPQPARITTAYGLNTAGAVAGVLAATFYMLLHVGVTASSYVAAAVSAVCGLAALMLPKKAAARDEKKNVEGDGAANAEPGSGTMSTTSMHALAALSGFGTLALQVLYIRLFARIFHNSTYTFGGIVAVFLVALALASWACGALSRRVEPRRIIGWACLVGSVVIPASVILLSAVTGFHYFEPGGGFAQYVAASLGLIAVVIVPPVFLVGLILPALWLETRSTAMVGQMVGKLASVNTIAATAGSLAASFVVLPTIGMWAGFACLSGIYLPGGALLSSQKPFRAPRLMVAAIGIAGVLWVCLGVLGTERSAGSLFESDTAYGHIEVLERKDEGQERPDLWIRENKHYTLGATAGSQSELLQGRLPLVLHRAAKTVCYLGLATGITAGEALVDPRVEHVDTVELVPAVVEAAKFFADYNHNVAGNLGAQPAPDPRSTIIINDARHHLLASNTRYDVICSDLFVPWHSQTGYLYTVEHYQLCRARLAPGGLFAQWLPLYQLGARETALIADTFASVFPNTYVYADLIDPNMPRLALIGTEEPLADPNRREVRSLYRGRWPAHPGALLNTDEHPRVEFLAPVTHREHNLLSGERLERFRIDVLDRLPK